jgi:hypothetical protein
MTRHARHGSAGLELLLDEDILDGTGLSRVLSAARQPTQAEELAGLSSARAAFVATFNPPHTVRTHAGRRAGSRSVAGRLIALKAAAAVTGVTLVGGVAFAATQTNLLSNPTHHEHNQQAPQASQAGGTGGGPQGAQVTASAGSVPGRGASAAQGKGAGQPARSHSSNASAAAHPSPSHSPHPHPSNSSPSSPPGQSNAPQRKTSPSPHASSGRAGSPTAPAQAQRSASHSPAPQSPHLQ